MAPARVVGAAAASALGARTPSGGKGSSGARTCHARPCSTAQVAFPPRAAAPCRSGLDVDQDEIDRAVADLSLPAGAPPAPLATPGSPDLEFPDGESGEPDRLDRIAPVVLGVVAILLAAGGLHWAFASFDHGAIAMSVVAVAAVGGLIFKEATQPG